MLSKVDAFAIRNSLGGPSLLFMEVGQSLACVLYGSEVGS
jgi:hypothetical protein